MVHLYKSIFLLCIIICNYNPLLAQKSDLNWQKDDEILKWIQDHHVQTLGLGLIKNGKIEFTKVYGGAQNSLFNVASLTKPVTALVTMKLVELEKLSLDEPLYVYWSDEDVILNEYRKLLTARILLSHQSGFKNWRWLNEDKKLGFDFKPGSDYQYSGEGYEYLRKALKVKFGISLQELADELIFQPLQFNDMRYIWTNDDDSLRYAYNFDKDGNKYNIVKNIRPNAADDLLTSIQDYTKLIAAILNYHIISKSTFDILSQSQVASEKGKHFCLGFERYDFENGRFVLSHGGADDGVRTLFFMVPHTKDALVIFTNSDVGGNLYETLVRDFLEEYGQKIINIKTK